MRTMLRSHFKLLFVVCAVVLAIPAIALADIIQADDDGDTVAVDSNNSLTINPGQSAVRNGSFQLACGTPGAGSTTTPNSRHVESNQTVNVASDSFGAPSGGSIKLDDTLNTDDATALNTGSVWPTDGTSCSDYIASHPGLNGMRVVPACLAPCAWWAFDRASLSAVCERRPVRVRGHGLSVPSSMPGLIAARYSSCSAMCCLRF